MPVLNQKQFLICGDHVCINKAEAKQYFEQKFISRSKIIDDKQKKSVDLVQLNLKENSNNKKKITLQKKSKLLNRLKNYQKVKLKRLNQLLNKRKKLI